MRTIAEIEAEMDDVGAELALAAFNGYVATNAMERLKQLFDEREEAEE